MTASVAHPFKTVYVLGAGFSRDANLPLQNEIMDRLVSQVVSQENANADLRRILEGLITGGTAPTLADVFTLLDQALAEELHAFGLSWQSLAMARRALMDEVLTIIHKATHEARDDALQFYRSVAARLIALRISAGQGSDPLSIISLNWDCLLENTVYWCVRQADALGRVDVDYCCYTTPVSEGCPHTPSVLQKAKGLFNLKVLKLHGSANWLLCPTCGQLFTGLGSAAEHWNQYAFPQFCPFCQRFVPSEPEAGEAPRLEPFFVTPTFLKVFENPHIRMIWHNAYMELVEATRVVFVGYSLPEADYHLRALLRRAIRPSTAVVTVLIDRDEVDASTPAHLRSSLPAERYRAFFGDGRLTVDTRGTRGFFEEELAFGSLTESLDALRRQLQGGNGTGGS